MESTASDEMLYMVPVRLSMRPSAEAASRRASCSSWSRRAADGGGGVGGGGPSGLAGDRSGDSSVSLPHPSTLERPLERPEPLPDGQISEYDVVIS